MDFSLSSDQKLIKDSVDSFVADHYDFDKRDKLSRTAEGFSRENWKAMADLGWFGLAFPEDKGGFGGTPVETMILMEAFGKGLVLEPYLPCVILAGSALAYGATSPEHAAVLEQMIAGDKILTFASAEPRSRYEYSYARDDGEGERPGLRHRRREARRAVRRRGRRVRRDRPHERRAGRQVGHLARPDRREDAGHHSQRTTARSTASARATSPSPASKCRRARSSARPAKRCPCSTR